MNKTGAHVPPPNPANFVWLEMNDTKDIVVSLGGQPLVSVTLRAVEDVIGPIRIGLQITSVKSARQVRDQRLPLTVERTQSESTANPDEAKP